MGVGWGGRGVGVKKRGQKFSRHKFFQIFLDAEWEEPVVTTSITDIEFFHGFSYIESASRVKLAIVEIDKNGNTFGMTDHLADDDSSDGENMSGLIEIMFSQELKEHYFKLLKDDEKSLLALRKVKIHPPSASLSSDCICLSPKRQGRDRHNGFFKENFYAHLGSFESLELIKTHFELILNTTKVTVRQVFFSDSEFNQCDGHTDIIQFEDAEKLSIFAKSTDCKDHPFVIVCLIVWDFFSPKEAKHIEIELRKKFIPQMKRGKRGSVISGQKQVKILKN